MYEVCLVNKFLCFNGLMVERINGLIFLWEEIFCVYLFNFVLLLFSLVENFFFGSCGMNQGFVFDFISIESIIQVCGDFFVELLLESSSVSDD